MHISSNCDAATGARRLRNRSERVGRLELVPDPLFLQLPLRFMPEMLILAIRLSRVLPEQMGACANLVLVGIVHFRSPLLTRGWFDKPGARATFLSDLLQSRLGRLDLPACAVQNPSGN